jgi:diguanylate cyclase (GGDEF)-like protein/PAS domain S-box-containing protein
MDISEAKVNEQRLRAIADNLPVLITYLDDQLRLRSMNATFEEWLGIAPANVVGMPLRDVIGPTLFAQREQQLRRALAGERVQFELRSTALGITRDLQNIYVPDVQVDGRVAGIYVLTTDISPMKEAQRRLAELARLDALTGLPNRRQFDEALNQALTRAHRDGSAVGLLFLDIDHFKSINDDHGHGTGDLVLKEFALRLQSCVRATDTVARLAGDEFVAILVGLAEVADASAVAEKILDCMRQAVPVGQTALRVSTSIGVVVQRTGSVTPQELMARADQALYQAKRGGRDRYAEYEI